MHKCDRCTIGLEAPELAYQLTHHTDYHPELSQDMRAFALLLLEWLGIRRPLAHEQACVQAQAYLHDSQDPATAALVMQQCAASLATGSSNHHHQQVNPHDLLSSSYCCLAGICCMQHLLTVYKLSCTSQLGCHVASAQQAVYAAL